MKKKAILQLFHNRLIVAITLISLLFFMALALDISPFLRGPAPYSPDWRWAYLFVNTLPKIGPVLLIIFGILLLYYRVEKTQHISKKNTVLFLGLLIMLHFLLQFGVLYFSRSGIPVLIHRIINPDLNGYFTSATQLTDVRMFLTNYTDIVLKLSMHAQGHPPGAILFFYGINKLASLFPQLHSVTSVINPSHGDVAVFWQQLKPYEKTGVFLSIFIIPLLSSVTNLPLYFATKLVASEKIAFRATFLYTFIPSVILFMPLNDVFLPLFTATSLYFFLRGIKSSDNRFLILSGVALSLGAFFSLSLLPLLLFFGFLFLFLQQKKLFAAQTFFSGLCFLCGFLIIPILLFVLYGIQYFSLILTLMSGLPKQRAYTTWVLYNLYDFFIFAGIPILVLFLTQAKQQISFIGRKYFKRSSPIFWAFFLMLMILNFSGSVRGEVGRIWIPFIPLLVMLTAIFVSKLKFTTREFLVILLLQAIQIHIMQEFWVMLW